MKKLLLLFFLISAEVFCQNDISSEKNQSNTKNIEIVYAGTLNIDAEKFPGATIFNADEQKQVHFKHEGLEVWCDLAVLYQQTNLVKAYGNIFVQQGDSLKMDSGFIQYDGNTKMALAKEKVVLRNEKMTLETEELIFDRNLQEAYYTNFGKITDERNVLTSKEGRYFVEPKKNKFLSDVKITNPDVTIHSSMLDYFHPTGHLYMFGATIIEGKDYKIYTDLGFYDSKVEEGNFTKNSKIQYDNKIIFGDSLYFNKKRSFSSASKNIKIIDTINNVVVKGNYAEVFKEKDSMFITDKALVISLMEKDSVYMHALKILVTGKEKDRIIRAFPNARLFKSDMQGKCDSIHASENSGITQLIGKPVLWNGENQVTGDTIHIKADTKKQVLDSLKVFYNAFLVEKDTIGKEGFNQVKGKILYGKFKDKKLRTIDLHQNTEVIYYAYDEDYTLTGINKTKCSQIQVRLDKSQQMEEIIFYTNVEGGIYPEDKLPKEERKFPNFLWRGDERIRNKVEIFN